MLNDGSVETPNAVIGHDGVWNASGSRELKESAYVIGRQKVV